MNKELKQKIKDEIKNIIDEIEYEESRFNQIFHSNIEFQKSFYKFEKIYEKYGKEAYLKYVPRKYKTQELKSLIKEEQFVDIYEHYGVKTLKNLEYTLKLTQNEGKTHNVFKLLIIKLKKLLSRKFISLPKQTILALPCGFSEVTTKIVENSNKNNNNIEVESDTISVNEINNNNSDNNNEDMYKN